MTRTLAKDIALAGVKSVTLYDPEPVTLQDLSSQVSNTFIKHNDLLILVVFLEGI